MAAHGLLNVDKPPGLTSRQVVDRVARLVRPAKAGHAGTLDPLATGVLVVCIGSATRLIQYLHQLPKSYVGTFLLGRRSTTDDIQGEVTELDPAPVPALAEILWAARSMRGPISQRPPAFSAIKVQGQRAYKLARQGLLPQLEPRTVTVHRLEVTEYRYPELTLSIDCSSGTYVRSIGRDMAEALGTAAVMSKLVRTAVGRFTLDKAVAWDRLVPEAWPALLLPSLDAVDVLPRLSLSESELTAIRLGQTIPPHTALGEGPQWAAVDSQGRLVAILQRRPDGSLGPSCNLPTD